MQLQHYLEDQLYAILIIYLNNNPDNLEVGINSDIMETMTDCLPIEKQTDMPRNIFVTVN